MNVMPQIGLATEALGMRRFVAGTGKLTMFAVLTSQVACALGLMPSYSEILFWIFLCNLRSHQVCGETDRQRHQVKGKSIVGHDSRQWTGIDYFS